MFNTTSLCWDKKPNNVTVAALLFTVANSHFLRVFHYVTNLVNDSYLSTFCQ